MSEVIRKDLDGALGGVVEHIVADLSLDGRSDQSFVSVDYCRRYVFISGASRLGNDAVVQIIEHDIRGYFHRYLKKFLFFSAVDRKNAVSGDLFEGLAVLVVLCIYRVLLLSLSYVEYAVIKGLRTERLSVFGIIGDILCDYIARSRERGADVGHTFFFTDERLCRFFYRGDVFESLFHKKLGKVLKTSFSCNRCSRLSLGSEGTVYIVDLGDRFRVKDSRFDLGGKVALRFDE